MTGLLACEVRPCHQKGDALAVLVNSREAKQVSALYDERDSKEKPLEVRHNVIAIEPQ